MFPVIHTVSLELAQAETKQDHPAQMPVFRGVYLQIPISYICIKAPMLQRLVTTYVLKEVRAL